MGIRRSGESFAKKSHALLKLDRIIKMYFLNNLQVLVKMMTPLGTVLSLEAKLFAHQVKRLGLKFEILRY